MPNPENCQHGVYHGWNCKECDRIVEEFKKTGLGRLLFRCKCNTDDPSSNPECPVHGDNREWSA
jgi:hypothetical protein